jgi:hypothetical protein
VIQPELLDHKNSQDNLYRESCRALYRELCRDELLAKNLSLNFLFNLIETLHLIGLYMT